MAIHSVLDAKSNKSAVVQASKRSKIIKTAQYARSRWTTASRTGSYNGNGMPPQMVKMDKVVSCNGGPGGQEDRHRKEIIIKKAVAILRRSQPMQMEVIKDKESNSNQNNEENATKS